MTGSGREQDTVLSESSFDAWIKFGKGDSKSFNAESDYYGKVQASACFSISRSASGQTTITPLDDVMRALYHRFPLSGKGYTVDDLQKISEEFAGSSFKNFFDNYIHGNDPASTGKTTLRYAGLDLQALDFRAKAMASAPRHMTRMESQCPRNSRRFPGFTTQGSISVTKSWPSMAVASEAASLQDRIAEFQSGRQGESDILRDDVLRELEVTLRLQDVPSYKIVKTANPTPTEIDL